MENSEVFDKEFFLKTLHSLVEIYRNQHISSRGEELKTLFEDGFAILESSALVISELGTELIGAITGLMSLKEIMALEEYPKSGMALGHMKICRILYNNQKTINNHGKKS